MRFFTAFLAVIVLCAVLTHCTDHSESSLLFTRVPHDSTGVDHENTIVESDEINVVDFYFTYNGSGVGVGDFNNDGLPDLFFGNNMESSRMYLNRGGFRFEDVTYKSGVSTSEWVLGISVVDINDDGLLDAYINTAQSPNILFVNEGVSEDGIPKFADRASEYGLADMSTSVQSAFFDYDGDGDLDMFMLTNGVDARDGDLLVPRMSKDRDGVLTDKLYTNVGSPDSLGHPYYVDVSEQAGITSGGYGLGVAVDDFNNDGWPDIYVSNDFITDDQLYINRKDGTFEEVARQSQYHQSYSSMGVDAGDINNDLRSDIVVVDMLSDDPSRVRQTRPGMQYERFVRELDFGYMPKFERNAVHLNRGTDGQNTPYFSDVSQLLGVQATGWSWSSLLYDFDNNGWRDIFITNGFGKDILNLDFIEDVAQGTTFGSRESKEKKRDEFYESLGGISLPNYIYSNTGAFEFEKQNGNWLTEEPIYSTGAAVIDIDNDGTLDIVTNNVNDSPSIFRNNLEGVDSSNNWIKVKFDGPPRNRRGIGSKIYVYTEAGPQYYYVNPVKGYLSSVIGPVHIGIGESQAVDSLRIVWSDNSSKVLRNIEAKDTVLVSYEEGEATEVTSSSTSTVFRQVNDKYEISYSHQGSSYEDFFDNPMLPRMYSRGGPGVAVGDLDGRHGLDFVVGGSAGQPTTLFKQTSEGTFEASNLYPAHADYVDMGILVFDSNNDGANDIYVVSGGSEYSADSMYQDRLYINDGSGSFTYADEKTPLIESSGSCVVASDINKDGFLDLFVCGRYNHRAYPHPPRSYILLNEGGTFVDATSTMAPILARAGMITSAIWSDFNNDNWPDLILVGEWMEPKFIINDGGTLKDATSDVGISNLNGLWNSLYGSDITKNGEIEYILGNLGTNNSYSSDNDLPFTMVADDFDLDGDIDPVLSYYYGGGEDGHLFPYHGRNDFLSHLPAFKRGVPDYNSYAHMSLVDILGEDQVADAFKLEVHTLESLILEGVSRNTVAKHALSPEAQFSPIYGMIANDVDHNSEMDLLLFGNMLSSEILYGWQGASFGLYLKKSHDGMFSSVSNEDSGLFYKGDHRSLSLTYDGSSNKIFLLSTNSDSLIAFSPSSVSSSQVYIAEPHDAYAIITYDDDSQRKKEFYYGSGYLAQSARAIEINDRVKRVEVFDYSNNRRIVDF